MASYKGFVSLDLSPKSLGIQVERDGNEEIRLKGMRGNDTRGITIFNYSGAAQWNCTDSVKTPLLVAGIH